MFLKVNGNTKLKVRFKTPSNGYAVTFEGGVFCLRNFEKPVLETRIYIPLNGVFYISQAENIATIESEPIKSRAVQVFDKEFIKPKKTGVQSNPNYSGIAYTDQKTGRIYTGLKFKQLPYCAKVFVIEHERAHRFYEDEHKTDLYAMNELLKKGFSLFQCVDSLKSNLSISIENQNRIQKLYTIAKNIDHE